MPRYPAQMTDDRAKRQNRWPSARYSLLRRDQTGGLDGHVQGERRVKRTLGNVDVDARLARGNMSLGWGGVCRVAFL